VALLCTVPTAWSAWPHDPDGKARAPERSPYYDVVYFINKDGDTKTINVRPYPKWLEPPLPKRADYSFELNTQGPGRGIYRLSSDEVERIDYFELRMTRQAAERLGVSFDVLTRAATAVDASRAGEDRLAAAERLLADAIDGHNSAVQQGRRLGPEWTEHVLHPLAAALLNVRLGHIDSLIARGEAARAQELCDRVAASLRAAHEPLRPALQVRYEALLLAPAERAASKHEYERARRLLDEFTATFRPVDPEERAAKLSRRLRADAVDLLKQAESLPVERQREALELIAAAAKAAPELPELDALRRRLKTAYPTLHCAYAELPTTWLPQNVRLTAERHAAALLYERLVLPVAGGVGFQPQLAVEYPRALAKGQSFELPRAPAAKWSDFSEREPHLLTTADVAWTIRLLARDTMPGFSPAWSQAIAGAEPASDNDPFRLNIRLSRDHWQPLSFMHFAVLPKHRFPQGGTRQEWEAFAETPVGSGPYRLAERAERTVRFVANPNYRLQERPILREVTFTLMPPDEAVLELYEERVHLVADLPPQMVKQVRERDGKVATLHPPSVWFLAPNFRRPAMANQDLRLALAHAIDRRAILDAVFRAATSEGDHVELTGPFPSTSWAYDHDVTPFDPQQAGPLAEEAKRKLGNLSPLKLVYRTSEPGAADACQQIAAQAAQVGLQIDPVGLRAAEFFPRVLDEHDFDLAYWRHDFNDETYWLGGLFDVDSRAGAPGGPNFLGYTPDASVIEFFRDLALHKRFVDLQRTMRKLHAHVARTAIVVPLWQLSTYVAVDQALKGAELDPLTPFGDVANWELKTDAAP
jgi:peptide/nickel transport system substrate-binding protein